MAVPTSSSARGARKSTTKESRTTAAKIDSKIDVEKRRALIAEAAYLRSERRGFEPGHEEEDWLAAEAEIDLALTASTKAVQ